MRRLKLHHVYIVTMTVWVLMLLPSLTVWKDSIPLLIFMSWYANFTSDLNNWMTARMKEKADGEDR